MTDLERLISWMKERNYTAKQLSGELSYSGDCVSGVAAGRVGINHSFRCRFGRAFGRDELNSVFQDCIVPDCLDGYGDWQEHGKAHSRVNKAIREGELLHPTQHKCHGCHNQAHQFHHESYHPEDRLCVVPLCRKCHRNHHTGKQVLSFGVVPTHIGLVRIATAGA